MKTWTMYKEDPSWLLDHYKSKGFNTSHITFDENLNCDFRRRASSTHDGTLIFTQENINAVFKPLLKMQSFSKSKPLQEGIKKMEYKIGMLYQFNIFSKFNINGHMMLGQKERVMLPVECFNIY